MIVVIIVKNDNHNNNDKDYWVLKRHLLIKLLGTTDKSDIRVIINKLYLHIKQYKPFCFICVIYRLEGGGDYFQQIYFLQINIMARMHYAATNSGTFKKREYGI